MLQQQQQQRGSSSSTGNSNTHSKTATTTTTTIEEKDIIDVSTSFGNMYLNFCLYNASGPRSGTIEALHKIALSKSGAIVTKSSTLYKQDGNPLPRTHHHHHDTINHSNNNNNSMASFNSEGLPNYGIDYYIASETRMEVMKYNNNNNDGDDTGDTGDTTTTTINKPYIVSISGKSLEDNIEMIRRIVAANYNHHHQKDDVPKIASIEYNVACPNIIGKPIIGYDMEQMKNTLQQIDIVLQECKKMYNNSTNVDVIPSLGIKLPPYLDFSHFESVSEIINSYSHIISYVVTMNTLGNALCIDGVYMETPYIASNNGYAGLSGPAIHYTALANVRKLRELLLPTIQIVGVGGICTGQDVYNMILCGANACQIATQHWKENTIPCFQRIYNELITIMQQKGYTNIQLQVWNQLQPYNKERANIARQQQRQQQEKVTKVVDTTTTVVNGIHPVKNDVQFYQTISIILSIILAIVLFYELQQQQQQQQRGGISLLPTE